MSGVYIFDIEADAINDVRNIWMIGAVDLITDEWHEFSGDRIADGMIFLEEADILIGHNAIGYDARVLREVTNGLCDLPASKIIDTLDLSRELFPEMGRHRLKDWGDVFDFPKLDHNDFSAYSPEMSVYCERDCRLNKLMFEFMMETNSDVIEMILAEIIGGR